MLDLESAIKHCEEVVEEQEEIAIYTPNEMLTSDVDIEKCQECANEHRQLAKWLRELKVYKSRRGQWLRMSDLSEQEDDRYKCSHCGNVVHYKDKMNLYTFNSWCGRCGSDNGRN